MPQSAGTPAATNSTMPHHESASSAVIPPTAAVAPFFVAPRPPALPSSASSVSPWVDWRSDDTGKMWLLVKEGIHIILDRILLKDNAHLSAKCPLYGRLSRTEKRAAVLSYASRMVLKKPLRRDVLVDTISMCVFEACEQEAVLEAPNSDSKKSKPRVPFMQKVMGEAMSELLGSSADADDRDVASNLIKQNAGEAVIADAVDRMRDVWMSAQVTMFFDRVAESDKPSPLVYDVGVEEQLGVQYFLPELPTLTPAAERDLADAIRLDENEAGKETVFAANLKKALKLIRQSRKPGATGEDEDGNALDVLALPRGGGSSSMGDSVDDDSHSVGSAGTAESSSTATSGGTPSTAGEWWLDQAWILRHCHLPAAELGAQLLQAPSVWFSQWRNMSSDERREVMSLSALETCDVIDHHPLWFSLRGMVGCNLLRDGMWPIISNDGHLSCVHFSKDSRSRFWYVPESMAITALFPMFMSWARTMSDTLRFELRAMGWALGEGRLDEVSRGVQYQLENAVVSFVLFKIVSRCMQRHAARAAAALADSLIQEELAEEAARESKGSKKARKRAKDKARKAAERAKEEEAQRAAQAEEEKRASERRAVAAAQHEANQAALAKQHAARAAQEQAAARKAAAAAAVAAATSSKKQPLVAAPQAASSPHSSNGGASSSKREARLAAARSQGSVQQKGAPQAGLPSAVSALPPPSIGDSTPPSMLHDAHSSGAHTSSSSLSSRGGGFGGSGHSLGLDFGMPLSSFGLMGGDGVSLMGGDAPRDDLAGLTHDTWDFNLGLGLPTSAPSSLASSAPPARTAPLSSVQSPNSTLGGGGMGGLGYTGAPLSALGGGMSLGVGDMYGGGMSSLSGLGLPSANMQSSDFAAAGAPSTGAGATQ